MAWAAPSWMPKNLMTRITADLPSAVDYEAQAR